MRSANCTTPTTSSTRTTKKRRASRLCSRRAGASGGQAERRQGPCATWCTGLLCPVLSSSPPCTCNGVAKTPARRRGSADPSALSGQQVAVAELCPHEVLQLSYQHGGPVGSPRAASREGWLVYMSENLAVVKVSATAEDKVDPDLAVFTLRFGKKCETQ